MQTDIPATEVEPLSDPSRALLSDYRAATGPTEGRLEAIWSAVESDIAAAAAPAATAELAIASTKSSWALAAAAVLGLGALGGVGLVVFSDPVSISDDHEVVSAEPLGEEAPSTKREFDDGPGRSSQAEKAEPSFAVAHASERDVAETARSDRHTKNHSQPAARAGSSSRHPSKSTRPHASSKGNDASVASPLKGAAIHSLGEERALLQRARGSLAAGQPKACLRHLARYDKAFREGILREEREVLGIRALCGLGKTRQAEARAHRFRTRHPVSPHSDGLLGDCAK